MSGRRPKNPNLSVQEEEKSAQIILWSEDKKAVNLYLKYNEEERNIDDCQESASAEISSDKKELLDKGNIDNDFDNDVKTVMETGTIKKEINNTTKELNFDDGSLFLPETIKQEEVHIKSEDYENEKLKTRKSGNQVVLHQCADCPYKTPRKRNLKRHASIHNKNNTILKCSKCSYETLIPHCLKRHQIEHKTSTQWLYCTECSFKTYQPSRMQTHILAHNSDAFKCSKCSYQSRTKGQLTVHQVKHESMDKWHPCSLCSYKTYAKSLLKRHCENCHSPGPNPKQIIEIFKCTECPYESVYCKQNGKTHRLNQDQNSSPQCSEYVSKTPDRSLLNNHQGCHQEENAEGWHKCSECSYKTPYKHALRKHVIFHKSADKARRRFACSQCCFKTSYQNSLTQHQLKHKESHEIEWFCCHDCVFKTKYKSGLRKHMSKHKKKQEDNGD